MEFTAQWLENNSGLILAYIVKIVVALAIIFIGRWLAKTVSGLMQKALGRRQVDRAVGAFLSSIVYALILAATVLVAFGHVGIETTSFIAILGAAGLAVGLALQGSLANFASGVLIILFRPFKAGDFVEAGGVSGSVHKIEIFSTVLKTPDNKVIILPNSLITGAPITNYSTSPTRRIDLVIGVGYDADLQQAKQILNNIVAGHPAILEEPAPTVAVVELADSSVNFAVRPWVNTADYWPTHFDLMETIKLKLDENNISIPFPQMEVHMQSQTGD
ncbi:mechanosensitive ion channel [Exilibacterium tricleocarpae]|uniref:Small-conductance mechanosensitive channel n=1 Tax=Exilibacterium tricleocarpae TaxID=2591008 RepID=A0A545TFQ2_9GAMM|nr:mechanosensitive ion channel domain-containing protein [Exilibacterium tricleocarpae]TQV76025.1 mechanosensitive ion channel [Exilibacterium tricleocarpae]